ncbi:MAG: hypothetical protein ABR581_12290 [Thermoleophilaceae bacterium]
MARFTRPGSQSGQASVELLGAMPFLLLAGLFAWQLALIGQTAWLCSNAARVAARADLVERSPLRAARSALPHPLERGLQVRRGERGVKVTVRLPLLMRRWQAPVPISARASLGRRP